MKNTHQNTNRTEMPAQTPDTLTFTAEPDDLRMTINLSLRFLHYQRVAVNHTGGDRTPQ